MDNDPKHTSGPTKDFLFSNCINHVETPAQSPVSTFNIKFKKKLKICFFNTEFLLIRKRDHDRRVPERPHKNYSQWASLS